jgi:hypothetical protein
MKGDYEEFHALKTGENKANSKPILNGIRSILPITQKIAAALRASQ